MWPQLTGPTQPRGCPACILYSMVCVILLEGVGMVLHSDKFGKQMLMTCSRRDRGYSKKLKSVRSPTVKKKLQSVANIH